jgi:predicted outer membrane protein
MINTRHARLSLGFAPIAVAAVMIGVVASSSTSAAAAPASASHVQGVTHPVTDDPKGPDPFNGAIPGDVSNGNGTLPPAQNSPDASPVFENALPGAHLTNTRFGPIDDVDRLFLIKVREAGLWERPSCLRAATQAENARLKDICQILASDHQQLDQEDRNVARQLNVGLPDQPNADQQAWMREYWLMRGHEFDVHAVRWLRFAHGQVFGAIAAVRAGTRNELMRLFAERANSMVNKHMSLLESTGLVQYDALPHAAIGGGAAALANAKVPTLDKKTNRTQQDIDAAWTPKNLSIFEPFIIALLIGGGLLAVASVRRVVNGD